VCGVSFCAALVLFVSGLTLPAISITKFAWLGETYSVIEGVMAFWARGQYALFAVVMAFSVVLPGAKLGVGLWAWIYGARDRTAFGRMIRLLAGISKWSMLDVFIVALMVLALEGTLFTASDIRIGIVLFAASIVLSTLGMLRLVRAMETGPGLSAIEST
jgi:paraquat-inducible protein A